MSTSASIFLSLITTSKPAFNSFTRANQSMHVVQIKPKAIKASTTPVTSSGEIAPTNTSSNFVQKNLITRSRREKQETGNVLECKNAYFRSLSVAPKTSSTERFHLFEFPLRAETCFKIGHFMCRSRLPRSCFYTSLACGNTSLSAGNAIKIYTRDGTF